MKSKRRQQSAKMPANRQSAGFDVAAPSGRTSLHLLNLKPASEEATRTEITPRQAAWQRLLNERIHLADLHQHRSLSVRPRGWHDFPPRQATNVAHAVVATAEKICREHPLSDLTVVSLLQLMLLTAWRILTWPWRQLRRRAFPEARPKMKSPALRLLPLVAVPIPTAPRLGKRQLLAFAMLSGCLILPLGTYGSLTALASERENITAVGARGVDDLKRAGLAIASRRYDQALAAFGQAENSFREAKREAGPLGNAVLAVAALFPTDSPLSSAAPLMTAGREAALGGAILARGLVIVDNPDADPLTKVNSLKLSLDGALPHLELAAAALDKVNPNALPDQYRAAFTQVKETLPPALSEMRRATAAVDLLPLLMGADGPKRYLVIFQNNAELRPTGGFIGSFALVDVEHGRVVKTEIPGGGSYDLQGSLKLRLAAPQPLRLINPNWEFQDANWFADFPTSAAKLTWFYEKSGGPTVDGVISITARLLERLLEVTGPIDMPAYGKTIDSRNFWLETQRAVELEYDQDANRPKQIIADMAPILLERLQTTDGARLIQLAAVLDESLTGKELLLWSRRPLLQDKIDALGWNGAVRQVTGDYLQVVHTNVAGQKTDLVMRESIEHVAKVEPNGATVVTLTIRRRHDGVKGALFTGARNVDWLRVYVPRGSTLIESSGFTPPDPKLFDVAPDGREIDEALTGQELSAVVDVKNGTRSFIESDKTVFANWVQTDPGEESVVTLVYRLPNGTVTVTKPESADGSSASRRLDYALTVQKQPGSNVGDFVSSLDLPRGFALSSSWPERTTDDRGRLRTLQSLNRDLTITASAHE